MAKKEIPKVPVQNRERLGSRYSARLRKGGRLPAVIYGHGQETLSVSIDNGQFVDLIESHTRLIEVQVDSKSEPCLVKEVQWDHLGSTIVHVDLARVDLTERISVEVEIELTGEAIGLEESGAILEQPLTSIEVECLATEIPDSIKVDVSNLKVDEAITVGDIKLPEGVTTDADADTIVAAISIVEEEAAPEAPAEATEQPEVIGKKPEEGAEAAAPAKEGGKK